MDVELNTVLASLSRFASRIGWVNTRATRKQAETLVQNLKERMEVEEE